MKTEDAHLNVSLYHLKFLSIITTSTLNHCTRERTLKQLFSIGMKNVRRKFLEVRAPRENKTKEKEAEQLYIQSTP